MLALELSRNRADIESVLHSDDPGAAVTAGAKISSRTDVEKARAIQWWANVLDLIFIPIYTFFL